MISINVTSTVAELQKAIERTRNEKLPKVQEVALNWTATEIKNGLIEEMKRVFDRPSPYTLNGMFIDPARRGRLEAHIYFKDFATKGTAAGKYLKPQIEGGARNIKRLEYALRAQGLPSDMYVVPARDAPLDQYGNVPASFIIRMLSDLRAFGGDSRYANRKAGRRTGKRGAGNPNNAFFAVWPGAKGASGSARTAHLRPGIYWRLPNRFITMVFVFTRTPGYRKRFDFFGVGTRIALEQYPIRYARAWQYVVAKGIG